jgi:hypothetical protein
LLNGVPKGLAGLIANGVTEESPVSALDWSGNCVNGSEAPELKLELEFSVLSKLLRWPNALPVSKLVKFVPGQDTPATGAALTPGVTVNTRRSLLR